MAHGIKVGDSVHIPFVNKTGVVINVIPKEKTRGLFVSGKYDSLLIEFVDGTSQSWSARDVEKVASNGAVAPGGPAPEDKQPDRPRHASPIKIVIFKHKNNPRLVITVKAYPSMSIAEIDNPQNVRFPYVVGQVLNMGHRTWACNNGYLVNDEDPCPEKKIFGMRAKDIPQGHPLRHLYPGKFRVDGGPVDSDGMSGTDGVLKFNDGTSIIWNKKNYVVFNYEDLYLENGEDWVLDGISTGIVVSDKPITIDDYLKQRIKQKLMPNNPPDNIEKIGDVFFNDERVIKFMEVPEGRTLKPIDKNKWFFFFDLDTHSSKFYSYGHKYKNTDITIKDKTFLENTQYKNTYYFSSVVSEQYKYYDIKFYVSLTFTGLVSNDTINKISLAVFQTFDQFIDWCKRLPKGEKISSQISYEITYWENPSHRNYYKPQTDTGIVDIDSKKLVSEIKLVL
jgi:hypothetical protein